MSGPPEKLRVALAGCGAVGGALLERFLDGGTVAGRPVSVVRVLVRRSSAQRSHLVPAETWTTDLDRFLRTPADVVVEAIGGLSPASAIAQDVLGRGGRLITANKALLATQGAALSALAQRSGGSLGFEAAVGGGVPVVRALRHAVRHQPVRVFRGILNGTTNFVLSRIEAGDGLDRAIAAAQARGLAEADPSRDLDGRDVADKLAILAWVAWGIDPGRVRVDRTGLPRDVAARVRAAGRAGARLRLIGECQRDAAGVHAVVRVETVAADSAFGQTLDEQNRLEIDLGWGMPLALSGPGAGGVPTAAAVWSDLVDTAVTA